MILKRSSALLLIGMIIMSMVLSPLITLAQGNEESSPDSLHEAENLQETTVEMAETEKIIVDSKLVESVVTAESDSQISTEWVNVPEAKDPPQASGVIDSSKTTNEGHTKTHNQAETVGEPVANEDMVTEEVPIADPENNTMSIMPMADATPGVYTTDPNARVVPTILDGTSTNNHTMPEMMWANGDTVYFAVKSTHDIQSVTINNETSTMFDEYNPTISILIDGLEYKPVGLRGNDKDTKWTIIKFNLSNLKLIDDGSYPFDIQGIGVGHSMDGFFKVTIPKIDVAGEKAWSGGTERPAITLQLKAHVGNEEKKIVSSGVVNGTETSAWTYKWEQVPQYDPYGREYIYTVDEETVPLNYDKTIDGLKVTNTYNPAQINIEVNKKWIGPAADSVTIKLFADNVDTGKSLVLNDSNKWNDLFADLNKFRDITGEEINYSVEEVAIDGYSTVKTVAENGFTFTNTNDATIAVDVLKKWVGSEAGPVTIKLLVDDEDTEQELILNEANNWEGSFTDLRQYDATTGEELVYSVEEAGIPVGYEVSYSTGDSGELIVTNTEIVGTLTVSKVDENDNPLEGAVFELRDSDGNLVEKTKDVNGEVLFEGLQWGDYSLVEIKAPDGYRKLSQPISITIGPGDLLHIKKKVVNTKIGWEIPKTGGIGTAGFYGFGALLMALTLGFFIRKRKPTE